MEIFIFKYLLITCSILYGKYVCAANDTNGYPMNILPLEKFGNKSYYFVHSFKADFLQANQFCQDVHMRLLTVNSKEENNFLYNKVQQFNKADIYWTSGTKLVDGNNYIWLSTGERLKYNNWHFNQPDNPNDYCLRLWLTRNQDLRFDDTACLFALNFICEREDDKIDQPNEINKNWENIFEDLSTAPDVKLSSYKNKSYYINDHFIADYLQAVQFCQLVDMELLSIESEDENTILYEQIRNGMAGIKFWTSGTRLIDDNNWYWLPTGNQISYFHWLANRPENKISERKCIQLNEDINKGLFWADERCIEKSHFICQTSTKNIRTRNCPTSCTNNSCPDQPTSPTTTPSPPLQPTNVKEKKYYLGAEKATFNESILFCQNRSMDLTSIQNKDQNDAINTQLQLKNNGETYWTSGNRLADKKTWYWLNNEKITYFNWAKGEPNNLVQNEYCIEIVRVLNDTKWNDNPCYMKHYYICESLVDTPVSVLVETVVNVNVDTKVVTCNGAVSDTKKITTITNNKPGGGVEVNNNIIKSDENVTTTKVPIKATVHQANSSKNSLN